MFERLMQKIDSMISRQINGLLNELEKRNRKLIAEAYQKGYVEATEDVCRRLNEIYAFGFEIGKADALAEAGMINIDDDVTRILEGETE